MLKVVSFKVCPFVQRVTALLEAKNLPYEIEYIDLKNKAQWFLDISPNGQVPVLITENNMALFESDAIFEFLEEAYPALQPKLAFEQKAQDRAWSYLASKHYLVQCSTMRSPDQATLAEREEKLTKAFAKAEKQLGKGPYFNGELISTVDLAWLPLLHRASIIENHTCHDFLAEYPKVKQWQQTLAKTGLFESSVSEDFEQKFINFYLSDQTHLGQISDCKFETSNTCSNTSCC